MIDRKISLSIRGFDCSVAKAAEIVGQSPTLSGAKGDLTKSGAALGRSFLLYERNFGADDSWDDVVRSFLDELGGSSALARSLSILGSEFTQLNFALPIRNSEEQEDRFLSNDVVRILADLGVTLTFGFI